jgi:hypothetical protein
MLNCQGGNFHPAPCCANIFTVEQLIKVRSPCTKGRVEDGTCETNFFPGRKALSSFPDFNTLLIVK